MSLKERSVRLSEVKGTFKYILITCVSTHWYSLMQWYSIKCPYVFLTDSACTIKINDMSVDNVDSEILSAASLMRSKENKSSDGSHEKLTDHLLNHHISVSDIIKILPLGTKPIHQLFSVLAMSREIILENIGQLNNFNSCSNQ